MVADLIMMSFWGGKQNRSCFSVGLRAVGVWDRVAESWQGLVGVFLFSRYGVCQRQARGDRGCSVLGSLLGLFFSHLREAAVSGLGLPQGKIR